MNTNEKKLKEENQHLWERVQFLEQHDELTGLLKPNLYFRRIDDILESAPDTEFSLLCFSIKNLKLLNIRQSSQYTDKLLCHIALFLQKSGRDMELFLASRIYADTFSVFLPSSEECSMTEQIFLAFTEFPQTPAAPSIGVSRVTGPNLDAQQLHKQSMMAASSIYGNADRRVAVYGDALCNDFILEQTILAKFDSALERREFKLYFQPKYNMSTGKIVGSEALVRWTPPSGAISPGKFVPVLEQYNLIQSLDYYMWDSVCRWLHDQLASGRSPLPVSVNVSRASVCNMDVAAIFSTLIEKYSLTPSLVEIEITESAYAEHPDIIKKTVDNLHLAGFIVLMDDFGSGYSSLSLLADTNIDILKLDMKFLSCDTPKSNYILSTVIRMSYWLNLRIIAEGVENQLQAETLQRMGCSYAQGFLYSRPIPDTEFEALLMTRDVADFTDNGEQREQLKSLVSSYELFSHNMMNEQMTEKLMGAVTIFSLENHMLRILNVNEAFCQLFGTDSIPCQGEELLRVLRPKDANYVLSICARTAKLYSTQGEVFFLQREGKPAYIKVHLYCLTQKVNGGIFYARMSDSTEQFTTLNKLYLNEQRYQIAIQTGDIISFELDTTSRKAHGSPQFLKYFGLASASLTMPEGLFERGLVVEGWEAQLCRLCLSVYSEKHMASCTLKMRRADGSPRENRITITRIFNPDGSMSSRALGIIEHV